MIYLINYLPAGYISADLLPEGFLQQEKWLLLNN